VRRSRKEESMAEGADLNRVVALADQLAERILTALENRVLTTEEFRKSREVALVAEVAAMLQDAAIALPPGIRRLGKAAERTSIAAPPKTAPKWLRRARS
jgi:hypothetical protein